MYCLHGNLNKKYGNCLFTSVAIYIQKFISLEDNPLLPVIQSLGTNSSNSILKTYQSYYKELL